MNKVKGIFILCACHFSELIAHSNGFYHIFSCPTITFVFKNRQIMKGIWKAFSRILFNMFSIVAWSIIWPEGRRIYSMSEWFWLKKYVQIYENGMAEWLTAPWKDMMSLGTEETNHVFYDFPVILSSNVIGRRQGSIYYLFQNGS